MKRFAGQGVVWLLLALLLVACGDDEPTPTPTPTQTPAPPPTATATPQAVSAVLPTATALATSPLVTTTDSITSADALTAALSVEAATLTIAARSANCPIQPDLDLASYEDAEGALGCPVEAALFDPVAINEFGPGPDFDRFMLWFSNEQQIYVLSPDMRWTVYPDTWVEGDPTFTCNPLGGEEESPPLPRRGFGKVWCTVEGLVEVMGSVPREERLCQHTVVQRFATGRLLACYEDATIRYIRLLDDGTWETVLTR
jgi:hypothetical protein